MEKVEVDPKLFITCRLCLEFMGVYQIVPTIQEKIKYCFDIDVAPFDGLPQLICKTCEEKLSEYFFIKTTYTEKQKSLISKIHTKNASNTGTPEPRPEMRPEMRPETRPETPSNNQQTTEAPVTPAITGENAVKNQKKRIMSNTSEDDSIPLNTKSVLTKLKPPKRLKTASTAWKQNYIRNFRCRLCYTSSIGKSYLVKHIANIHSQLFKKYGDILKTPCKVELIKIDDRLNITGDINTVALSKDIIMENNVGSNYHIMYKLKTQHVSPEIIKSNTHKNQIEEVSSDSSDDFVFMNRKNRKKVRRLLSTDTVILEDKRNTETPKISESTENMEEFNDNYSKNEMISECINLDSESDSTDDLNTSSKSIALGPKHTDGAYLKATRNIAEVCRSKYIKKMSNSEKRQNSKKYDEIKSQIKHKILSMGRKVINKQGINCTGLLRYMEHRNLGIFWRLKAHEEGSNYIRINISLKHDCEIYKEHDTGWVTIPLAANKQYDEVTTAPICNFNKINNGASEKEVSPQVSSDFVTIDFNSDLDLKVIAESNDNRAILSKCNDSEGISSSKLLNENPVANPKQLPKLVYSHDPKHSKNRVESNIKAFGKVDQSLLIAVDEENLNSDLSMPIITSTTSLAVPATIDEGKANTNSNLAFSATQTLDNSNRPRIKVKPVSELMPEKSVNIDVRGIQEIKNNIWQVSQDEHVNMNVTTQNNFYPSILLTQSQCNGQQIIHLPVITMPSSSSVNTVLKEQDGKQDFVILNTVEMPNTKTNAPLVYFQNLLSIHNITLIDNVDNLPQDTVCLVKFKVQFKQGNLRPLVLALSLYFSYENTFHMGFKDTNNMPIERHKITADWQWEILKIYQGDVHNKICANAQRQGLVVYDITKKFINLLKSINAVNK